ncbi:peroxiredoxin family protein [Luteolibacter sp. AS25]|uniref:peroxiredoxin family protein n=1 Tax=Luteolibacter sp. AS25 TaxID=3135776 RepID=UPI00398AB4D4
MLKIILLSILLLPTLSLASQPEAERIKRNYELSAEKWLLEMKLATTAEQQQALSAGRPDPVKTAGDLWTAITPSLKEEWTLPYAAFFIEITSGLTVPDANGTPQQAFSKDRDRLISFIKLNHLKSSSITPFCIALYNSGNPQALPILEDIAGEHPDESVQGIAALGAAVILKGLGDDSELMKKRLGYLRKAIIQSADKTIAGRSVADIASDQLYIIRYLTKGRTAPPFTGTDVAGRTVKLSDQVGKITVLLFWDAKSPQTDKIINLTNQMVTKFRDKPVNIIGITPESLDRIRSLQADGSIQWNNIHDPAGKLSDEYRISSRPSVYVLDEKGTIQFTGLPGSFAELTVDALLTGEDETE